MNNENDKQNEMSILDALRSLPLFDDVFLSMQATNLHIVDQYLEDLEEHLWAECTELEETPVQNAIFVSAISQLWVLGLYELFRTWRQRGRDILGFYEDLYSCAAAERDAKIKSKREQIESRGSMADGAADFYWHHYQKAAATEGFADEIRLAMDKTETFFRRVEALRMWLAKHEVPGIYGSYTIAPGYGRIDKFNGSIYWQVVLRDDEIDIVSRKTIADSCREIGSDQGRFLIPVKIQKTIKPFADIGYGRKRITVVLADGREFKGVHVMWCKAIVFVENHDRLPFEPKDIVDVRP